MFSISYPKLPGKHDTGILDMSEPLLEIGKRPGGYETAIRTSDRLVTFLYLLCRDTICAGELERLVAQAERAIDPAFSNDFIAAYAIECALRLQGTHSFEALNTARQHLVKAHQG